MVKKELKHIFILLGLSYIFFMLGNGLVSLSNPDEVFYAQTAKEMAKHNSWMVPYLFDAPQFEKPVLLYWLLRIGLIIFPNPNFAARFFPALFAGLGVVAVYFLSLLGFKNEKKGFYLSLDIDVLRIVYRISQDLIYRPDLFGIYPPVIDRILLGLHSRKKKGRRIIALLYFYGFRSFNQGAARVINSLLKRDCFFILRKKYQIFVFPVFSFRPLCFFFDRPAMVYIDDEALRLQLHL